MQVQILPAYTPAKAGVLRPWAMGFKTRCKWKALGLFTQYQTSVLIVGNDVLRYVSWVLVVMCSWEIKCGPIHTPIFQEVTYLNSNWPNVELNFDQKCQIFLKLSKIWANLEIENKKFGILQVVTNLTWGCFLLCTFVVHPHSDLWTEYFPTPA